MLSRLLREFLFTLVHLVVSVLVAVQSVYHRFWVKKFIFPKDVVTEHEVKMLLEHMPKMGKKLHHLVVLSDTQYDSMTDLAKIVIWSLIAGIPYVSFYDITGKLQEQEEKLFLEVERHKKGVPGCIKWSNKPNLNGYTNGMQSHTVILNIFTNENGQATIAKCIRNITENQIPCRRDSNEITVAEFDSVLSLVYPSIPDPDLALYSGPRCCTHGLLPWHIRLTEFIQLSKDHTVNIDGFIGAMYKYNKCDQRYGK